MNTQMTTGIATTDISLSASFKILRLAWLMIGPLLTIALGNAYVNNVSTTGIALVTAVMWSPLFFSIPALTLQNDRDLALPNMRNAFLRGILLIPHLMLSKTSPIRLETTVSVLVWMGLLIHYQHQLLTVLGRLL